MMEKLRIRSMVLALPAPGGGADYSDIAAARLAGRLGRLEISAHAVAIERIARKLELAGREHGNPQAVAANERLVAVDVDGFDAGFRAEQRREVLEERLAEMALGTAVERELDHSSQTASRTANRRRVACSSRRFSDETARKAPANAPAAPTAAAQS